MNIQFLDTQVIRLEIKPIEENTECKNDFNLSFDAFFKDEEPKEFLIVFKLFLTNEFGFLINVEYAARFSTTEEIDEKFKTCHFVNMNAPAIAYPFLRAYISTVTVNSGLIPVILPTVNFTKVSKNGAE